jgi:hypothetical protein
MAMHTGSCACGQIGIRAACEPQTVSMCHFLLCQKRTGSTYSVHAYFPTEDVRVAGTTKVYARKGDSGAQVYFHFCPECGSTMCWEAEASPGKTGIPVGVFADPTLTLRRPNGPWPCRQQPIDGRAIHPAAELSESSAPRS